MMGQFIEEDIQCQQPSQRSQRPRRQCENDGSGTKHVVPPSTKSEKGKLKPPTNAEQSELLQAAIEKGLRDTGLKGVALRQEMRQWEDVFSHSRARCLHALNPYAGERWSEILHEVIEGADFGDIPWEVTIINDNWLFSTDLRRPSERGLRWMLSRMRRAARGSCGVFHICSTRILRFVVKLLDIGLLSRCIGMA
jgi:hypothetical protein